MHPNVAAKHQEADEERKTPDRDRDKVARRAHTALLALPEA
jgi:hypothetical protein